MKTARLAFLLLVAGMSTACAPPQSLLPASGGPTIQGDGICHAERVAWAVGQPADEAVMKRVWKESGSGLIRLIAPKQAVTHDFRQDRLNVHIDANNLITQVACG